MDAPEWLFLRAGAHQHPWGTVWGTKHPLGYDMAHKWTPAQRAKFKATMAAKHNGGKKSTGNGMLAELQRKRRDHLVAAKKITRVITLLKEV